MAFSKKILGDSVASLPAPSLRVSVLAYPGGVVTRDICPRWLARNEFFTWWRPGLSVPGLTRCGQGLTARWRTSGRYSRGVFNNVLEVAFDGVLAAFLLSSLQLSLSLLLDEAYIVGMTVNVYSA